MKNKFLFSLVLVALCASCGGPNYGEARPFTGDASTWKRQLRSGQNYEKAGFQKLPGKPMEFSEVERIILADQMGKLFTTEEKAKQNFRQNAFR